MYDVTVVGAGIHGAGVAQAAAAAGYRVLLLEQTGIAAGTSSRSSKLVHGGLRYLETFQFGLVRESLRERRLLAKLAPDLVRLVPFYIPVYRQTRRQPWLIGTGLCLYALLGGLHRDNRFGLVPRSDWGKLDGMRTDGLRAVFHYQDGQTDDAALTRAVLASAQQLGTEIMIPASFSGADIGTDHIDVSYMQDGTRQTARTRVLVNAGGPWVNRIRDMLRPRPPGLDIDLVRGVHVKLDIRLQGGNYYLESPGDGRAVFVMSRGDTTLLGTTEALFQGDPADVVPTQDERDYLLAVLGHYFPACRNNMEQKVIGSFAGLRVLPGGSERAFRRSRETILIADSTDCPRVVSIYGGKLTTYRATAEKVMQRLTPALPLVKTRARTDQLLLAPD